jgi:hypothetical protein
MARKFNASTRAKYSVTSRDETISLASLVSLSFVLIGVGAGLRS